MKKLYLTLLLVLMPIWSYAACVADGDNWASTPDYTSVNTCLTNADAGDTITVSAGDGSEDWGSTLAITKAIKLIGPGAANLTIKRTVSGDLINILFADVTTKDNPVEISGFTFDVNNGALTQSSIRLGNSERTPTLQTSIKIHDNIFTSSSGVGAKGAAIWNKSTYYGVIYKNTFINMTYPIAHSGGVGDNRWWANSPENQFSTNSSPYYMYFEDNTITFPTGVQSQAVTDGEASIRYAFRYNDITLDTYNPNLFDIHGEQSTPFDACFGAELYGNDVNNGTNTLQFSDQRSGQMMVFFNAMTRVLTSAAFNVYTSAACVCPNDAYDALKVTHNSYYFGNRQGYNGSALGGVQATGGLSCNGLTGIPTAGRDVFGDNTSPGVSCGANRPGTCTVGAGHWVPASGQEGICDDLTDYVGVSPTTPISGTLYKCTATNTWTPYYTPYTYPHPLRSETDTTAPTATWEIDSTGLIATAKFNETVNATTKTGVSFTGSVTGAITATYKDGMPGGIVRYDLNKEVQQGETVVVDYSTPGDGIKDLAGNALADISDGAVSNASTQSSPPLYALTIGAHTGATVNVYPGINCGSTCGPVEYEGGTVLTLSVTTLANYTGCTIGGTSGCGASTTMNEAKTCTVTCTKIAADNKVGAGNPGHKVGAGNPAHKRY